MGINVVPLKELTPDEPKVLTLDLLKNMDPNDAQNEKSRGQLVAELVYKPFKEDEIPEDDDPNAVEKAPEGTPAGGGLLVVIVHEAEDVEGKHHTNPHVRLLFRGEEKRTKVHVCVIVCCFSVALWKVLSKRDIALAASRCALQKLLCVNLTIVFGISPASEEKQGSKMGGGVHIHAGRTSHK